MPTTRPVSQRAGHDCGVACAVYVLRRLGLRCAYDAVLADLQPTAHDGVHPSTLEGYLRNRCGLNVTAGEMSLEDVRHHTRARRPVVLVVNEHYVVAVRVARGKVLLMDPQQGYADTPVEDVEAIWRDETRHGAVYDQYGIAAWQRDR
jgi:ABC-type bacteriocin/lantibiotic exporter with double-glycine peptidase domain